tara:strand:- start:308 stop:424 length:117 start_codon:yes stop_codon:yes gene_type:complete
VEVEIPLQLLLLKVKMVEVLFFLQVQILKVVPEVVLQQ